MASSRRDRSICLYDLRSERVVKGRGLRGQAMLRCMILAAMLAAVPPALAWSPFGTQSGSFVSVQDRNRRGESNRPSRDRQDAQRRQGERERERNNTMTPDERRELNRDLQRANREFYRKGREGR
jgi:hypothetical protein